MYDRGVRTEQDPFQPAEDGSICADAQGEAQNCERRKTGAAPQLPKAVTQVLDKILQDASPSSIAALLFDLRDPAHGAHGRAARLFSGHACRNVFVDLLLEMLAKLFFHLLIHLIGMENGAQTQRKGIEPLFDVHIQASFSCTMPEMAADTRFQLAVSFSSCLRPSGVRE